MSEPNRAKEAREWDEGKRTPAGWVDAPERIPRAVEAEEVNLRMPRAVLQLLEEFARRRETSVDVLVVRWLEERLARERDRLRARLPVVELGSAKIVRRAAAFRAGAEDQISEESGYEDMGRMARRLSRDEPEDS